MITFCPCPPVRGTSRAIGCPPRTSKPPKLQRKISGHGYDGVGDNPDEPKEHGYESLEKKPPPDPRVKCD
jgi:hypothetical protein